MSIKALTTNLKYCYGIKGLDHNFSFANGNTILIYAPNGVMKTSFARVFNTISRGELPRDEVFPERKTVCEIFDETNTRLQKESIFVIVPYDESFESKMLSTLLINKELKQKYEDLHKDIEKRKDVLLKEVRKKSGLRDIEGPFTAAFKKSENDFFVLLNEISEEVLVSKGITLADITYKDIVNPKVEEFLKQPDIQNKIKEYIEKFDQLTSNSPVFRKGGFNHYNANVVSKSLNENNFFAASHFVTLMLGADLLPVKTSDELNTIVEEEKKKILHESELAGRFHAIEKMITTEALRGFRDFLAKHQELIPEIADFEKFKQKLWVGYFTSDSEGYKNFLAEYSKAKSEIEIIVEAAKKEGTRWAKVVAEFNERFDLPIELEIQNQKDVILSGDAPSIAFTYIDEKDRASVGKTDLFRILSQGEKRALYILNVMFEINARKTLGTHQILIFDDIADSFDYKNKYAIVEYLKEVTGHSAFTSFILTHNFDFFRTVMKRVPIRRENCLMTERVGKELRLEVAQYANNPFVAIKKNLKQARAGEQNFQEVVAFIPFVRNLVEYTSSSDSDDYKLLTSLLHLKKDTMTISVSQLNQVFSKTVDVPVNSTSTKTVMEQIFIEADNMISPTDTLCLIKKTVLAIAIRIKAEKYMLEKINTPQKTDQIEGSQTGELFEIFKNLPNLEPQKKLIQRVLLMTSENIHLNAFMYEPILDLSDDHLRKLYNSIKELQ